MPGNVCFFDKCRNNSIKTPERYFVPFVKPHQDIRRCKEWIHLCGRPSIPVDKIKRWTFVCDEHFNAGEVLDPKFNKTLKPIPRQQQVQNALPRQQQVQNARANPDQNVELGEDLSFTGPAEKTYSKPASKLENTVSKHLNQLIEIKNMLPQNKHKDVIEEIIRDFNETKRYSQDH